MYLLPSMLTSLNLFWGFYAILQAVQATNATPWHFDNAAKAIGIAVVFDGLDGAVARLTNTASEFGKELDSLADMVAFGVAPAVLAWMWGFHFVPLAGMQEDLLHLLQFGSIAATFAFLGCGAARLARFNVSINPQPKNPGRPGRKYFVGMPIPGGAGCVAAVIHFSHGWPVQIWWQSLLWLAYISFCGFLMVSTWRFWSTKSINLQSRHSYRLIPIFGLTLCLVLFFSYYFLLAVTLLYMVSGVLARLAYGLSRQRRLQLPVAGEETKIS
jgi:CDP-diacylglycerol--serine O-phosphatidyltransferase